MSLRNVWLPKSVKPAMYRVAYPDGQHKLVCEAHLAKNVERQARIAQDDYGPSCEICMEMWMYAPSRKDTRK